VRAHLAALCERVKLLPGADQRVFIDIDSLLRAGVSGQIVVRGDFENLAHAVAQHHWTQPTTDHRTLTTRRGQTGNTGRAGQTSRYPPPTLRNQDQIHPGRCDGKPIGGSRLSQDERPLPQQFATAAGA